MIAIISVFIIVANIFIQRGFNTALIQKENTDEVDFSSVFYLSLFTAGLIYLIIFFTSPFIAEFYGEPQLVLILRVLAIIIFFGAIVSIQRAFIARNMMFKKLFFSSLGAIIISGTAGIVAAYMGWGAWALVILQLTNYLVMMIILWFTVKWRPRLLFSLARVKILFSFGYKLLASSLLSVIHNEIRTLIIGKIYTPFTLGFYNRGQQFPKIIAFNIDGAIESVIFPALSFHQKNREKVKNMVRRSVITSTFIVFPVMVFLAASAEPIIRVVLTDKWIKAIPFLQIFCASYALLPIHTANLQAINAIGRSDIFLKVEIIKKVIGFIILAISIPFGIYAIAWGVFVSAVINTFINAYPNFRLLNYRYLEQIKDILPSLLISLAMGGIIYSFNFLPIEVWQILIMQVILGASLYIGFAKLFKIESLKYLIATTKEILKDRKRSVKK